MAENADRIPFELEALHDMPLPEECRGAGINAYLSMRAIYRDYKRGYIKKEQASEEKKKVIRQYLHDKECEEIIAAIASQKKRIEIPAMEYAKHPTLRNADRFYAAVYGLPEDWRKEAIQYED